MNRDKALTIADRIMTRIEDDKAIHKDAIADEIQAGDAIDEGADVISHDGEKWVHSDGAPFDIDKAHRRFLDEGVMSGVKWTPEDLKKIFSRAKWGAPLPINRIGTKS